MSSSLSRCCLARRVSRARAGRARESGRLVHLSGQPSRVSSSASASSARSERRNRDSAGAAGHHRPGADSSTYDDGTQLAPSQLRGTNGAAARARRRSTTPPATRSTSPSAPGMSVDARRPRLQHDHRRVHRARDRDRRGRQRAEARARLRAVLRRQPEPPRTASSASTATSASSMATATARWTSPTTARSSRTRSQADADGDGIGDACDPVQGSTAVYLDSQPGDYIGGGQRGLLIVTSGIHARASAAQRTPGGGSRSTSRGRPLVRSTSRAVQLRSRGVRGRSAKLPSAIRAGPASRVTAGARGCNYARRALRRSCEAVFADDGSVVHLAIDFEQHCEGAPAALFGAVRINSLLAPSPTFDRDGDHVARPRRQLPRHAERRAGRPGRRRVRRRLRPVPGRARRPRCVSPGSRRSARRRSWSS